MSLRFVRAGFATVQDLGRTGDAQRYGVPCGGAFDEWALRAGNRLCGNDDGAAAIEFVLRGPEIVFKADVTAVVTGAPFAATLDGVVLQPGRVFRAARGSTLAIGSSPWGARGYLCVAGGIDTPVVLGSRGASPRAGIGAMLSTGDEVPVGAPRPPGADADFDRPRPDGTIRVVAGPQTFAPGALEVLLSAEFAVTPDADRTGVRLDGPALQRDTHEIDPEGTVPGAIQVPADGRPIVLGPDGPATGGYAKIATVIADDRWLVAQARPGDRLRFRPHDGAGASGEGTGDE